MKEKIDLRVIKTKKALYTSLIELTKDKPFEQIKVSDICETSLVNRSTFYSHYNDKYELLYDYVNSLKQELLAILDKNKNIVNTKEYYTEMIRLILDHLDEQKSTYNSILINNQNNIITDILLDVTVKDINKRIEINHLNQKNTPTDILVIFYLGAVAGVLIEWLKNDNKYTKQEIIKYLNELIPDDIGE